MAKYNIMLSSDSNEESAIYYIDRKVGPSDINEAVYQAICHVAQEVLDRSTCHFGGERTASELAGKAGYLDAVQTMTCDKHLKLPPRIRINVGAREWKDATFTLSFCTDGVFAQMAEWEGVMGLTSRQVRKLHVEHSLDSKLELKPYKRRHGYKPRTISMADENRRIAKRFEALGLLAQGLTSDGMRRALAVLTAVDAAVRKYGRWIKAPAMKFMTRRLWDEYGRKDSAPMDFTASDFDCAPDVWRQVDEAYAKELLKDFVSLLRSNPAPAGFEKGGYVRFRHQENIQKRYQGRFRVEELKFGLDYYCKTVSWYVSIIRRGVLETYNVGMLEPDAEETKAVKPKAVGVPRPQPVPTPAEQLRDALLRLAA